VDRLSSPAQAANQAIRKFLRSLGKEYDIKRKLKPFSDNKDIYIIRKYFHDKCCYCRKSIMNIQWYKDHLIPMNKEQGGLHAWGNIVPSCKDCNGKKQGRDWIIFIKSFRLNPNAEESRMRRIRGYIQRYNYKLTTQNINDISLLSTNLYLSITTFVSNEVENQLKLGVNLLK
jgi:hypothetical protein